MVPLRFELRSQESEPCMLTNYTIGPTAPTGNRTQGKCLEGIYVTTTPLVLLLTKIKIDYKSLITISSQSP